MVFISRVSRVSIALSLIAAAVIGIHVVSVESNTKINIGVNGIHVVSVKSFEKTTATCHFSFEHAWKTSTVKGDFCKKTANVLLKTDRCKNKNKEISKKYIYFSCHECREFNWKITSNLCITCRECWEGSFLLRFTMYILIQSLRITTFFELKLQITPNFELNLRITTT